MFDRDAMTDGVEALEGREAGEQIVAKNYAETLPSSLDPEVGTESLAQLESALRDTQMLMWFERAWEVSDERMKRAFAISLLRMLLRKLDAISSNFFLEVVLERMPVEFVDTDLEEVKTLTLAKTVAALKERWQHDDLFRKVVLEAATKAIESGELANAIAEGVLTEDDR